MNSTNITFSFLEKIEKANNDFSLFDKDSRILAGLSGGADSVSLVLSLKMLSEKYGFTLCALHVNHMIRGKEADRDEDFSRSLCEKLGIQFFCERADVPALAEKSGESVELCARNVRYSAFEKICKEQNMNVVATAHNANDNAETVLFNLARGTGIKGMCGIPPKRILCDGIFVIRPLIYIGRKEIEEFLSFNRHTFVTDSTNECSDYTRNYIRHEILPLFERINTSFEESIVRSSNLLRQDEDYLSSVAKMNVTDDINTLSQLHEGILSRVVIELFASVSDETLSEHHVKGVCERIKSFDGRKTSISLPDSMTARLEKGKITFEKDTRGAETVCDFDILLGVGSTFFEENPYALYISFDQNKDIPQTLENGEIVYKKYTTDYLYFDTIPHVLFARNRRDGDKIQSKGMNKSIKRIMTDSAFGVKERYLVPFICDNEEILLVPGCVKNDKCKKSEHADKIMSVSLYRKV